MSLENLNPYQKPFVSKHQQHGRWNIPRQCFSAAVFTFDSAEEMRAAFAEESDDNIYSRFSNPTVDEFVSKDVCA
jgi:O-succinylhomoserine sulfhydrylase